VTPMLDVQKRWAESFRIRLGEKRISAKSKKEYPASLDGQIRITSASEAVIDAIVNVYGGVTSDWQGQRQAMLTTDHLRIVVLPGESCVGWWEQWRKKDGGMPVCTHRCDGERNYQDGGSPCSCPTIEDRLADKEHYCQPTTRLWVMLPDVEIIGTGRLETHGIIAAETLPQSVDVLKHALAQGEMVPALLRIVKVESSGKSFVVPRIEVTGISLDQLLAGGVARSPQLSPAGSPTLPSPSPSGEGGPVSTVDIAAGQGSPAGSDSTITGLVGGADLITQHEINKIRKNFASIGIVSDLDICARLTAQLGKPIGDLRALSSHDLSEVLG